MNSKALTDTWLYKYLDEINKGKWIVGIELYTELERLIHDFENPRYYYDTRNADLRMDFMEHCVKLTKSPYYGRQPVR